MRLLPISKRAPLLAVAAIFLGLGLSGCDDRLERFRDPDVRIPHGATWAWRPSTPQRKVISRDEIRPPGDRRDGFRRDDYQGDASVATGDNEMVRGRIRVAIEKELARKGLRRVEDPRDAEFLVDYRAGIHRENRTVEHVYPGSFPGLVCGPFGCWDSWGYGPPEISYENIHFREGMIVFNFIQHGSNKIAYRAIGEKHVNHNYFKQENIDEAVQHLLKDLKPGR